MNWEKGQQLRSLTKPLITREQLKAYADASGDHNPLHLDDDFAKELGFPSVVAHGMLSMAFMAEHALFNFPEDQYQLLRLRGKFRKVTLPGDVPTCEGSVRQVKGNEITVGLRIKNQKEEVTTDGEATFRKL